MSRTLNTPRANGHTTARKPAQTPAATPHEPSRSILPLKNPSLSQLKPSRLRLPAQPKNLPAPHPPATLRRANSTLKLVSGLHSPAQTPLPTIKHDGKSRLPRAAPTPSATLNIANPGTKRLRIKKASTLRAPSPISAPSPSPSLAPTPQPHLSQSASTKASSASTDSDLTPKKPSSRPFKPNASSVSTNADEQPSANLPAPPTVTRLSQQTSIAFPSIVTELTPRRPMTRARSKNIRDRSTSSLSVSQDQPAGTSQLTRKPSRVMQIAQAFQQEAMLNETHSKSMLGVTPQRRTSNFPNRSVVSPADSVIGNSPNISALAASLSKQHGQRDRLSLARSARSSVTDMLRYSTMSTLGGLHWEDGVGDVLLTDPNETEAMVADISMSKGTPFKPEVQSAAIALASARANFLNIVQENEAETGPSTPAGAPRRKPDDRDHPVNSPSANTVRPSFGFLPGATPLSRSRISISSFSSTSPLGQVIAHESQLAALSSSLKQAHHREREVTREIQRLATNNNPLPPSHPHAAKKGGVKKLADQERERSLVEEITRLEAELEEAKELNIELENALDLVTFENAENLNKYLAVQEEHGALLAELGPSAPIKSAAKQQFGPANAHLAHQHQQELGFEKYNAFSHQVSAEIAAIQDHLKLIGFIKISLALGADLFPPAKPSSP